MSDNVHALLGAYAVDAVTDAERAAFDAHLPDCDDCAGELAGLREAVAVLGDAEAATPPPSLRAAVMAQVARTAQLPPSAPETTEPVTALPVAASPVDAPESDESAARERRAPRWVRARLAVAASIAALALGGVGGAVLLAERNAEVALEKDVMMVASAPDAKAMDLDLGVAHLVVSDRMDAVVAMGDDCPPPKDGMTFQLWVMTADGETRAGPTFTPDKDGTFMMLMDELDVGDVVAFAVTEEPGGGSEQPTSDKLAVVEL